MTNTRYQVAFQIIDRFTGEKRLTADEVEAGQALENGDFITINEITRTSLHTEQEVTTIVSTHFPTRRPS
jgi:hypothetical protein